MRRTQTIGLIVYAAFTVAAQSGSRAAHKFDGQMALKFTRDLVEFGPRPSGSGAHEAMQRYLTKQLRSFGCTAEPMAFTGQTPHGAIPMHNYLVRVGGATESRPIVISGHYDTKLLPGFVGANDGGSSAGLLLELARVLCPSKGKGAVWLVWLDGEESVEDWTSTDSLYGSRWLAAKWQKDGTASRIKALINVDMIGDRDLNLLMDMNSSNQLRELFWQTGRELGYGQHLESSAGAIEDDHIPFGRAGIPALDIIDFSYGPMNSYWHTERDTVGKLSAASFQVIGDILLRILDKIGEI